MPRQAIDGERKAVLSPVKGGYRYDGLFRRSQWSQMEETLVVTQRALNGAALHLETLNGQYPTVGTIFPKRLFKGRQSGMRTGGVAMAAKLEESANQRKLERQALKTINQLHKLINL